MLETPSIIMYRIWSVKIIICGLSAGKSFIGAPLNDYTRNSIILDQYINPKYYLILCGQEIINHVLNAEVQMHNIMVRGYVLVAIIECNIKKILNLTKTENVKDI